MPWTQQPPLSASLESGVEDNGETLSSVKSPSSSSTKVRFCFTQLFPSSKINEISRYKRDASAYSLLARDEGERNGMALILVGSLSSVIMGGSMPVYAILFGEVLGSSPNQSTKLEPTQSFIPSSSLSSESSSAWPCFFKLVCSALPEVVWLPSSG